MVEPFIKELNIPYKASVYPNRRFVKLLEDQQIDFSLMIKSTLSQPEKATFSQVAIGIVELRVYWLAAKTPPDIAQVTVLLNKPVITIAGFSYGGLFSRAPFEQMPLTVVENHQRAQ